MDYVQIAQAHIADHYPLIVYAKPRIMDLPPGAIIGTWHYSIPGNCRFILDREEEIAAGVLPGDLARAWIRDVYPLPIKRRKAQLDQGFQVPLHARIGDHGDCVYLDISGAYLSALSLGYDVEYELQQYIGAHPEQVPPEIVKNKRAYAIAVTMSGNRMSEFEVMGKEGIYKRKPINTFSNPCLYALANDVLNAVGAEMIAVLGQHVVYANTDGYVVHQTHEKYAQAIIESWGFKWHVAIRNGIVLRGETSIRGVGSYRINGYQTRRYDVHAEDFTGEMMDRSQRGWLKARWIRWMGKIHPIE